MNASTLSRRFSLFFAALSLAPLIASAAPTPIDFKVLIDADNSETTGCTVITTAGLVKGIDQVLTTSVSYDSVAGTAAVTGVTRQTCTSSTLNTFSSSLPISSLPADGTGWPVGVGAGGNLTVETHIPMTALGGVAHMHLAFTAVSGSLVDGLVLDDEGSKIIWPPPPEVRRHAAGLASTRPITLDGADGDWFGVVPMALGFPNISSPALRFTGVRTYMNQNELFFVMSVQADANAPTANDDTYSVERGKSLGIGIPGVLANDTDPKGKPLTAVLISGSGTHHGALALNADGSFTYLNDGSPAPSDSFEYKANNGSSDSNTAHVDISITEPSSGPPPVAPKFTSANSTRFTIGTFGTFTITTTPVNPASTVTKSGALPNGVSFSAVPSSTTAKISGTPAPGTAGVYTLHLVADNHVPPPASQTFTLTVCDIIDVVTPATTTATANSPFSQSFTQTGAFGTATFTLNSGTLPTGLTLSSAGLLSGTPTVTGSFPITVKVTDANGCTRVSGTYPLDVICQTITVTNPATNTGTANTPFSQTFTASNTIGAVTFSTASTLPAGLTLSSAGVLSGTPTQTGPFSIVVHVVDGNTCPADGPTYSLTINCQTITVTNPATNTGTTNTAFSQTFTASNTIGATTFSTASTLPTGLTLATNGVLAGTPTQSGVFPIVVHVVDVNNCAANGPTYTLTINQPPAITSANAATFTVGAAGTFTVTTTGFPTGASMNISETGALPGGVTFVNNNNGTATLAGTPNAGSGGVYAITITANNGIAPNANQSFTFTVNEAPAITSANNVTFVVGQPGTFTVTTTGFPPPTLSETGALPGGVTFVNNGNGTATISGTPNAGTGGSYALTLGAANGNLPNASQSFTLTVNQAPAITSANAMTFAAGSGGTFTVTTTGFPTGASMVISESGALPGGVTFVNNNDGTATLAGTPSAGSGGVYAITITANNGVAPNATQNFTLTVNEAPAITSANNVAFKVGVAGTFTVTTTGFPAPALNESGALPGGVTFVDNGDGTATISGTPNAGTGGSYALTLGAANGNLPNASQSFTLTVNQAPAITSGNAVTFQTGQAGTFSVTTTGFPSGASMLISETGALPGGVTFVNNNNGTATLAGTPNVGTGGTYSITITANNGVTPNAAQSFTLTVNQPPAITSANNVTFKTGTAGTFSVTTTGFPTNASMLISETGALPGGVTLVNNNDGTATLAGTPNAGTGGVYTITINASNGVAPAASQSFTLTVNQAPAITSANNVTFQTGLAGTFSVTTTGFPSGASMLISETGALPGGVTFVDNNNGTATLAGTPNPGTGGVYLITITANNGVTPNGTQNFTLTVNQPPAITSANNTTFTVGQAGTFTVTTTGFPISAINETGALPGGVTLVDNNDGTATLAGTPNAGTGGTYSITINATNGVAPPAAQSFTLTVNQAPAITSANNVTFQAGQVGTFSVTTTGFPTNASMAISETGALPGGVTLVNNNDGTATLAGTPNAGTGGVYLITINANNGVAPAAAQSFTLTVNEAPSITSANQVIFTPNVAGTFTVTTTGFPTGASMAISETGALPNGVTFVNNNDGTATIAGTPTAGGIFPIVITASNGIAPDATQNFTIRVEQPPSITSANTTTFKVGTAGTFTVTTVGTPTPALSETGALPGGVTFVDNGNGTATLAGTPNAGTGGNYPITINATNGVLPNASQPFALVVQQAPAITTANNTTFKVGTAGTFTVSTTGFPTGASMAISETGALPGGVTLVNNNDGTATLAGTPNAGSGGIYVITITANNGVTPNATQGFTLTVNEAPAITSANNVTFQTGVAGTFSVTTTGFPTNASMVISETGALPGGVSFVNNNDGTATLAGTPNAGTGGIYSITIDANNGVTPNASQSFTLTVNQPPAITSANNITFKVGTAGTFSVTTTGFPTNASMIISETGALPGGVTLVNNNDGTATLAGTPSPGTGGVYPITINASNGVSPAASQSFTLTVNQAPSITSTNTATFQTGVAGTFGVTTTGFPTNASMVISETGALPGGVTFVNNNDGTATLAGTPNAGTGGSYPITITANNGVTPNATQNFTLVVNQPPAITSANSTTFKVGTAGTFGVTTTGFPTGASMNISETGALPGGVTFVNNNDGTATLAGTPDPGTGGTYPITINASNGVAPAAAQSFTLTVSQAPSITSTNAVTFHTNQAGTFTVNTTGFPTGASMLISETGALPSGVTFVNNNDGTATLAGTPASPGGGVYALTITANNGVTPNATQSFTLTVQDPPAITSANSYTAQSGSVLNFTVTTTGFPTPSLNQTGLPAGATFTDNGNGTATIGGTVSGGANTYPVTLGATNGVPPDASQNFSLIITCPTITPARTGGGSFPAGTIGTAYAGQSFTASGGTGPYTFAVTAGTFPTGLSLAGGAISGTPTATGTFSFTVTATDNGGCPGSAVFSIAINPSAGGDAYSNLAFNTQAFVSGGTSTAAANRAAVSLSGLITANDAPAGGIVLTTGTFATSKGGSVTIAADGTFTYTPPVTNNASVTPSPDSFTYTITSNTGGTATPTSAIGTVTLNLTNRVWYVDNTNVGTADGRSNTPFATLAAAQTASATGEIIFVYTGTGTTGQNAGITLKDNQQLIGQGVALVVNSLTLLPAGTAPQITNTAGNGVTLANGNTLKGFTVTGTSSNGISGTTTNGLTVDTVTATAAGAAASALVLTTPSNNVTLTNTTLSNSPFCLTINGGTANFTMNNTNTITANAGQRSINFANLGATAVVNIGAPITDNGIGMAVSNSVNGAAISFTGTQTLGTTTNAAVTLTTNGATSVTTFSGTLAITTGTGSGFVGGAGILNVSGTANITSGAAPAGLNLNGTTIGGSGITFNSVNTTGATTGISLTGFTAANHVTVNGGTISGGTTGISLSGANTSLTLAGVTVTGATTGISGSTFGTLTIGASVNVSATNALVLTTGAVSGTFANVTATAGGVSLTAVTGTWGATAGSLTGVAGSPTFNVSGGSGGTITWGASISQALANTVVTIAGGNSNTINFNGNVTSSGTSTGLSISASSGTYNFNGTNAFSGTGGVGGILISNGESGTITFSNATTNTAAGTANFQVDGSVSAVTAAITYSGTINNTIGSRLIDVNNLDSPGTLTMTHAPAAAGNLTQNANGGTGISIINSSSTNITIANASITVKNAGNAVTLSGNTGGTISLNGLATASSAGNKIGIALSGGGTVNVGAGAANPTINQSTGTGIAIDGNTTAFTGTLNLSNVTITGNGATAVTLGNAGTGGTLSGTSSTITNAGPALVLSGVALTNGAGMTSVTSSGGANGISLTSVSGGPYTISGGSISGNSGSAFLVSTSSATFSYSGPITQNTAAQKAVAISGVTGGTITLSGAITSNGGTGVSAAGTGGTVTFTGGMTLNGTASVFSATGAGMTVNVTGTNTVGGTTAVTSGTAVNITCTIGASNVTFQKVSSTGVASGIILSSTGSGNFTITGNGAANCKTTAANCDGGTIQTSTGPGMSFSTVNGAVSLTNVNVTGGSDDGIRGSTVGSFTLLTSRVTNNGNATTERGIEITGLGGSGAITNSTVTGNAEDNLWIQNNNVNLTAFNVTGSTFSNTSTSIGNDGIHIEGLGNSNMTASITGCTFDHNRGDHFQVTTDAVSAAVMNVTFSSNTLTGDRGTTYGGTDLGGSITINPGGTANITMTMNANNITGAVSSGITLNSSNSSQLHSTVSNNIIGTAGTVDSGSSQGDGINVTAINTSTNHAAITGNTIKQYSNLAGINITQSSGSASVQAVITGNTIANPGTFAAQGIFISAGAASGDNGTMCIDLGGAGALVNSFSGVGAGGTTDFRIRQRMTTTVRLPGYGGAATDTTAVINFIKARNTVSTGAADTNDPPGGGFIGGAACTAP